MKTDLEILIEHLQSEFDFLKSTMDQCVAEWDFEAALSLRESIRYTKRKLDVLKCLQNPNYARTGTPRYSIDDDKILELLELLANNEIRTIEFEVKKGKLYLMLEVKDELGEFRLRTNGQFEVERFLVGHTTSILANLGWNTDTYSKQIPGFHKMNKLKVLEELAIIYFEVFGVFGKAVDIKITI